MYIPRINETVEIEAYSRTKGAVIIKDATGKIVFFKKIVDNNAFSFDGRDEIKNKRLKLPRAPWVADGEYTISVRNKFHQTETYNGTDYQNHTPATPNRFSKKIRVENVARSGRAKLYHSKQVADLLHNTERRMAVLKRDVDTLMQRTLLEYPNAQPFQAKAVKSAAPIRIQQQQVPPEPSSTLSGPLPGDVPFDILNAQNDRLVEEGALIEQQIRWVASVRYKFSAKSIGVGDPELEELLKRKKNVDYGSGCFTYYSNRPEWKNEEENEETPQVIAYGATYNDDGSIRIRGAVRNPSDEMTLADVQPDLGGYFNYESLEKHGDLESGFEITIKNFDFTKKLAEDLPWLDDIPLKITICGDSCYSSKVFYPNVYEIAVEAKTSSAFKTSSSVRKGRCANTSVFPDFKSMNASADFILPPNIGAIYQASFDAVLHKKLKSGLFRQVKSEEIRMHRPPGIKGVVDLVSPITFSSSNIEAVEHGARSLTLTYKQPITEDLYTGPYSLKYKNTKISYISSSLPPRRVRNVSIKPKKGIDFWIFNRNEISSLTQSLKRAKCNFGANIDDRTAALFQFYDDKDTKTAFRDDQYQYALNQIACSGYDAPREGVVSSVPNRVKDDKFRFPPPIAKRGEVNNFEYIIEKHRFNDAERKIVEAFGRRYDVKLNLVENAPDPFDVVRSNNNAKGTLILYSDRKTCNHCQNLPYYMSKVLPNIDIIWFELKKDGASKARCLDNTFGFQGFPFEGRTK